MTHFLKKTLTFSSIFVIYAALMYGINTVIMKNQSPDLSGVKTLVIGDSHTKFALDPKILGTSVVNVSQTGEPYYVTYWKLKKILQRNTSVDTVILGFSYHNLSAFNDVKFADPFWSAEMFRRTYPIAEFEDLQNVKVDRLGYLEVKFKNMCLFPKTNHIYYLGNYQNSDQHNNSDFASVILRHYYYNNQNVGISNDAVNYLDSISMLCEEREVELVLVSNPMQKEYLTRIPENFVRAYKKTKNQLAKRGLLVFDYGHVGLKKEYFLDADHLNAKGAELFTKEIKAQLAATNNKNRAVAKLDIWPTAN